MDDDLIYEDEVELAHAERLANEATEESANLRAFIRRELITAPKGVRDTLWYRQFKERFEAMPFGWGDYLNGWRARDELK